jgi:hypothetical protein
MLTMRWILAATVALTATLPVAQARPPTGKCRSSAGNVQAINSRVVAYELGRPSAAPGNDALSGRLIGCSRATGNKIQLSGSTFGEYWYDRPARAVKVRGSTIGYGVVVDAGYGSTFATQIAFVDMRHPRAMASVRASGLIGSIDFAIAPEREGQDLTARRDAAWIQCPDLDEVMNADPRPNCIRPGLSVNKVFAVSRGATAAVQVGRGRTIDPLSVRLRDGRVSWVQSGRRRSAPLPG